MNARRKSYVDPEVQGALAKRLMLHWAIFIATATAIIFGLMWLGDPFTSPATHLRSMISVYGPVLLTLVCLAPVFVYDAVKLSNRFTGPMLRFKNATKALASGETPTKINLRGGDFWQDVAEDFNRVIDRFEPQSGDDNQTTA